MKQLFSIATVMSFLLFDASAQAPVNLGTASNFTVLAASGITIAASGLSHITGDIGSSPTATITGLENLTLIGINQGNNVLAQQAQTDLAIAQAEAASRTPDVTYPDGFDLGGQTLIPGVYKSPASLILSSILTLDGGGNPNAVWIIQAGSTLGTSTGSQVALINDAQAKNVFWQVGSSATLGSGSSFAGTLLAFTSITLTTGASVNGRLLAQNGAVVLDFNTLALEVTTRVVLYAFIVGTDEGRVVVRWQTGSEERTVGFFAERWDGNRWMRIHSAMVPAQGSGGLGASYSLVDAEAQSGNTYTYRLVEIETSGSEEVYGPFERTALALEWQNPIQVTANGILLQWLGRTDESYSIERSIHLGEGFVSIASGIPADPAGNEFLDPEIGRQALYRIAVDNNEDP